MLECRQGNYCPRNVFGFSGFSVVEIRNLFMLSFLRKQESSLYADLLDSCFRRNDKLRAFSNYYHTEPGRTMFFKETPKNDRNDQLRFRKSILVSIEHGHANKLSNDRSSTAYYYLSEPKASGSELLTVEDRLPRPNEPLY